MLLIRNNTHSKMYLILFMCILASGSLGAAINTRCESNSDCPKDSYCYTVTNECAPCAPNFCRRFHRKDSLWKKCPTEPHDCDSCLPGYEEEVFSDGSRRESCILSHQPTTAHATTHATTIEDSSLTYLSSIFGLPLLLLLIVGVAYNKFRFPVSNSKIPESVETELQPIRNQCNHGDSPVTNNVYAQASAPMLPPGYNRNEAPDSEETELQPLSNQCNHGSSTVSNNIYPHTTAPMHPPEYTRNDPYNLTKDMELPIPHYYERRIEVKPVSLVQAGVFRKPDYEEEQQDNADSVLDQEGEEEDLESQEEDSNQGECRSIPPLHYHDETTRPSEWTPGPLQSEEETTSMPPVSENGKRPSTEIASSEEDDEQSSKRLCNNQNEEENEEACSSSVVPPMYRNFTTALSSIRQNSNTANNNTQNKSTYSNLKEK